MKKFFSAVLLILASVLPLSAGEAGESWSRLYRRLADIKQKYAVLLNITPLDDRSLEPFLASSLDDLVTGDLSQYRESQATYDDWEILTRTIIRELGDIKAQSAVGSIWSVVESAEVPLLKAEALTALGMMRAVEYAPDIATILRNLNFNVRYDKDAAEIEAYGAVVALDKMKENVGFEPLFYASIGWYSDRITSLAHDAVLSVSDEPAEHLIRIMEDASDYRYKREALAMAMETDASPSDKGRVAVVALAEGLKYAETDQTRRGQLANLRVDAINQLIALRASDDRSPELLRRAIAEGDMDEQLIALQALGMDGSDEAAAVLVDRLEFFNDRQLSGVGVNNDELTLVRQIIFAMGESGNEAGLEPLGQMAYIGYTPAMVRLANQAIAKINGN